MGDDLISWIDHFQNGPMIDEINLRRRNETRDYPVIMMGQQEIVAGNGSRKQL